MGVHDVYLVKSATNVVLYVLVALLQSGCLFETTL